MTQIKDRIVFVTGANRGIGKALVQALLDHGAKKIYASARDIKKIPDFKDPRVVRVALDITNTAQLEAAAKLAYDTQILINNAGVLSNGSGLSAPFEDLERDMKTNYFGTLAAMRAFLPVLEKSKNAAIANVCSIASFVNFPFIGGYCASKAALFSITQGARLELAAKGIAVHTINPGPIDTDMARDIDMQKTSPEDTAKAIIKGLEAGEPDIFPDAGGRGMFEVWSKNYRDLEASVAASMDPAKAA